LGGATWAKGPRLSGIRFAIEDWRMPLSYIPVMSKPTNRNAASRNWTYLAVAWAWLLLVVGCNFSLVTIAGRDYNGVLLMAISCAGLATPLLVFAVRRGDLFARIAAAPALIPILFIIGDFIGRYRF